MNQKRGQDPRKEEDTKKAERLPLKVLYGITAGLSAVLQGTV